MQTQIDLNSNLLRIARERANANRGITPKKEHNGYLVLSSRQWIERYEHELTSAEYAEMPISFRRNHLYPCTTSKAATTWKSILQTPYDASLPLSCIQSKIENTDLWDNDILDDLGCPQMNSSELNGSYGIFEDNEGNECNGLYRWVYIANYRTGFWEMELYTTQSLTVPPSYRPVSC